MEQFDEEGIIKSTLVADSGYYDYNTETYKVMGNVVVVNAEKKQKLETEELSWDKSSKEIYTETKVKVTDEYNIINGTGLRADQDFSNYEIDNIIGSTSVN